MIELCKSKYAHHIVNKMMKYGNKEKVINRLLGHCMELLKHQFGASVIEEAFSERANSRQRCAMVEEFYGAEFAVFKPEKKRQLAQVLAEAPAKRAAILERLKDALSALLNKDHVPDCTLFHHVAAAYFSVCDVAGAVEIETLLREQLVRMVHTREGVCVALRCVEVASAKDRKAMIKSLKGHVADAARDSQGHLYVMALLDRTDDTELLKSALLEPLADALPDLATHTYGHLPLLHVLAPRCSRYFHPVAIKDMTFATDGTPACTTKKPAAQRRKELLAFLLPRLVAFCKESAPQLLCSVYGARILAETFWAAEAPEDVQALAAAIAQAYAQTPATIEAEAAAAAKRLAKKGKKRRHQEDLTEDYQDHLHDSENEEEENEDEEEEGEEEEEEGEKEKEEKKKMEVEAEAGAETAPGVNQVGNRWIQKILKEKDEGKAEKVAALWKALFDAIEERLGEWAEHRRLAFIVATLLSNVPEGGESKKSIKAKVAKKVDMTTLDEKLPGHKLLIAAIKELK